MGRSDQLANARAKPQLALRVGVTGARDLDGARLKDLHDEVRTALSRIRDEMVSLAREADAACFYATDNGTCTPLLRLISPLARGADRLVAEEALALGYKLYVPMPFSRTEYERDFTGTDLVKAPHAPPLTAAEDLQQFQTLLARSDQEWMSLDGDYDDKLHLKQDDQRERAYEAVGQFVVRNSDIIIAIWNGELAAGRGGTQQIVDYAASAGVPVWWIHATEIDHEPRWIGDVQDTRDLPAAPKAVEMIAPYLRRQIPGPEPVRRNRSVGITYVARWGQSTVNPAAVYFGERSRPLHPGWKFYKLMMQSTSRYKSAWKPPIKPSNEVGANWFELYEPADRRAVEYAARYRSSYVWIFFLTTLSVLFGAAANLFHGHELAVVLCAGFELVALLATFLIAIFALRRDWHERSIEYRLLAELCRKQQVLAPLGRAISFGVLRQLEAQIQEIAIQADPSPDKYPYGQRSSSRSGWVSWLFMAYQRAAPLPRGDVTPALLGTLSSDVLQDLVDEQLAYHKGRAQTSADAAEKFEWGAGLIFLIVVVLVFNKIALTLATGGADETTAILGFFGVFLPALSAAAVGIGSYAEWQVLIEDSHHMIDLLNLVKKRIQSLDLKRQLASQDLGAQADSVALTMLEDLEGWQRLFRVKIIETA